MGMDRDLSINDVNETGENKPRYRTEAELLESMGYKQVIFDIILTYKSDACLGNEQNNVYYFQFLNCFWMLFYSFWSHSCKHKKRFLHGILTFL
jgi:hypothetical protein